MRLYSYIQNEKGSKVQKGGNDVLRITLLTETEQGTWQTSTEEIVMALLWNKGKPELILHYPPTWSPQLTEGSKALQTTGTLHLTKE